MVSEYFELPTSHQSMCLLAMDFEKVMVITTSLRDQVFVSEWYCDADYVLNAE